MAESPPPAPASRPSWAKYLDGLGLLWSKISDRLIPRPKEAYLSKLARNHRPPPDPMRFRPEDHGVENHLTSGRAALERGALGEALHHFGSRLEQAPEDNWAWHGRGDALQLTGQFKEALNAYEKAIKFGPSEGIHRGGQANALTGLGRLVDAENAWKDALRLDPSLTWMRSDEL